MVMARPVWLLPPVWGAAVRAWPREGLRDMAEQGRVAPSQRPAERRGCWQGLPFHGSASFLWVFQTHRGAPYELRRLN